MFRVNPESSSSAEKQPPTREETLMALKRISISPEEAGQVFSSWLEQKQKEMDESKSQNSHLIYNVEVAELLLEANLIRDTEQYYEAAMDIVYNELGHPILTTSQDSGELADLIARLRRIFADLYEQ